MEDGKKKAIMIGVIVGCLAMAAIITMVTRPGGSSISKEPIGVKCANSKCNAEYQINPKEYKEFVEKNFKIMDKIKPAMTCEKCGEKSVYEATKCNKCGAVFFPGQAGRNKLRDTCPKCDYSEIKAKEDEAKKKLGL